MNRAILYLILFFLGFFNSNAFSESSIEGRVAAFIPLDSDFTDIYGHVSPCYQIEISTDLCGSLGLWANVDYMYSKGHLSYCGSSTIDIANLSLGPKYRWCIGSCIQLYAGIGAVVSWTHLKNKSCSDESGYCEKINKSNIGFIAKSGVVFDLSNCFFADIFCDYSYQPAFHYRVNIGGIRTGAGIGYKF